MTLDELIEEVYLITNRRDRVAETRSAVKAATLKMHSTDFYSKDILETGVSFPSLDFRQSLDYISLIPNFRSLKYFRRVEDENDSAGTFIAVVLPEEVLDSYNIGRTDIAYVAGRVLEIRAAVSFQFALMGAYVLPNVTDAAYVSWVAEQNPFAIVYEACRVIFQMLGQAEESNAYTRLAAEEVQLLRQQALSDVGY